MSLFDTIAAISTPYGRGGIAVLRISGADALAVADRVFVPKRRMSLSSIDSGRAVYGSIFGYKNGEKTQIDDGIAVIFRSPHSFTGEDTVEISCHGGVLLTQRVLESILASGARMAEAGEFTRRSFINGKTSLTGAEALGELLLATSDEQITLARSGMEGRLSSEIGDIYDSLCHILAALYAHIDYPDEDLADISREEMLSVAQKSLDRLSRLSRTYSTAHAIGEGIPTAIVGRTNSGKSTLYNLIVGRDAAIVTDIEGTTRDILTESVLLGKVTLRLSDTAGMRETLDTVESIGIERARRAAESAELILAVFDGSREAETEDLELASYLATLDGVKIGIVNKSDLGVCPSVTRLASALDHCIQLCANTGEGLPMLIECIEDIYIDRDLDMGRSAIVANARQNAAILQCIGALNEAVAAIHGSLPLEICASEMEGALKTLGEVDGRTVSEDIVSKIFASFCVGK